MSDYQDTDHSSSIKDESRHQSSFCRQEAARCQVLPSEMAILVMGLAVVYIGTYLLLMHCADDRDVYA